MASRFWILPTPLRNRSMDISLCSCTLVGLATCGSRTSTFAIFPPNSGSAIGEVQNENCCLDDFSRRGDGATACHAGARKAGGAVPRAGELAASDLDQERRGAEVFRPGAGA